MVLSNQLVSPLYPGSSALREGVELCKAGIPWASSVSVGWRDQITLGLVNKRRSGKVLEARVWKFTQRCFFDREGDSAWKMPHSCKPFVDSRTVSVKVVWIRGWKRMLPTSKCSGGSWPGSWVPFGLETSGVTWYKAYERHLAFYSFFP